VLVAGGALPPNPGELIESHSMERLLEQAKATYDLILIDTPPLTAVSDAFPLLRKVDGVAIVGRVGRNRRDVAERLHETLTGAGAPLLGVIANESKSGGPIPYPGAGVVCRRRVGQRGLYVGGVGPDRCWGLKRPDRQAEGYAFKAARARNTLVSASSAREDSKNAWTSSALSTSSRAVARETRCVRS
jgi:hypothetical protein